MPHSSRSVSPITVDIISDVVCPWCVIGYRRLELLAEELSITSSLIIRWHPFELTPDMPPEGKNLNQFLFDKYGDSFNGREEARLMLQSLGRELGFEFDYRPDTMRYNSFKAHQLVHFSRCYNLEHSMKKALFEANFTFNKNISDTSVLVDEASRVGLDPDKALQILEERTYVQAVREEQKYWQEMGIISIPFFLIDKSYVIQGTPELSYLREKLPEVIRQQKVNQKF